MWFIIVILIIIVIGTFYFIINSTEKKINNDQILSIAEQEVQQYCNQLDEIANSSSCPICGAGLGKYKEGNSSDMNYVIYSIQAEQNKNVIISMNVPIIIGYNNRPGGFSVLTFIFDENGNLIDKPNPPENSCFG